MRLPRPAASLLLTLGLVSLAAAGADLEKLRQKLARETDPADRAKITVKIGEELLDQASKRYKQGDFAEGEAALLEYRQAIHTAYDDLVETGRDARRKPKGFKQLEIHLRQARHRMEDMARSVAYDARQPIEEALKDMEEVRMKLLINLMQENPKGSDDSEGKPQ